MSNWYPSNFTVDDITYWCTEQYMMAKKAELFGDSRIYAKIMSSDNQREIKALGRQISGFDEHIWCQNRERIVYEGNYAKFTQNDKLMNYLIKQKDKILVEASPYDRIWGVGLSAEDNAILNPNYWQGQNLLGFVLMQVRDTILNERGYRV